MAETTEQQIITFRLGSETYGLQIGSVREIVTWKPFTRLPGQNGLVEGMIDLRGRVIPVINLGKQFGLGSTEANRDTRYVIVDVAGHLLGLSVDAVEEVARISADQIAPPDKSWTRDRQGFITGIARLGERLVIVVDMDRFLQDSVAELNLSHTH
ncbi:MAG: chemotaxis protein CheW [Bacillota bacterium]